MTRARTAAVVVAIASLAAAAAHSSALGAAPDRSSPIRMSAGLTSSSSTAHGRFYARVAPYGDRAQLHFNFTYPSMFGTFRWPYPGTAHIHLGRPTGPGRVVIELCDRAVGCGYGLSWSSSFPYELVSRMRARGAYVELHPRGSPAAYTLRGQIVFR